MGSRKRKVRDDDQLDDELVKWQDTKRQAVKVEDVWTSSSEGLGDANGSELEHEEVLLEGLSLGKDALEEEIGEVALTSEDPSSFESEADKENTDGGLSSLGSPGTDTAGTSCKTSPSENELPPPLSAWLLTPPSLNTQRKSFKLMSSETQFEPSQGSPLPQGLGWADPTEVWDIMINKDKLWGSYRDPDLFSKHPSLEPRMRAILLDWLIEVCEVYKLHRETYYLGQDFIDRFLSAQKDVPKQQLQLIGITCLFIAAKVEEIYPPKICEFAYVTDGACDESEILEKELIILKALNWDLSPVTVNSWMTIYLQLYGQDGFGTKDDCEDNDKDVEAESSEEIHARGTRRPEYLTTIRRARRRRGRRRSHLPNSSSVTLNPPSGDTFVFPQFPGIALARAAQLADFATLDSQSLRFPYSVIAASTLYHVWSKDVALTVSGLSFADIKSCVDWMSAFAITLKESGCTSQLSTQLEAVWARLGLGTSVGDTGTRGSALLRTIPRLVVDDSHNIQTHLVDLDLLEKAQERLSRLSPELIMTPPLVLTLSTSTSPTSSRDTNATSSPASLALLTPPASGMKSFSASSSVGNVNVTPSMSAGSYNSGDFCVG